MLILTSAIACTKSDSKTIDQLNSAEQLLETQPDSALSILRQVAPESLGAKKDRARYSLLMSMALDKNYIDVTSFDVLQPAIDYYMNNGSADERLKTDYYRTVIFMNQNKRDSALSCITQALYLSSDCKDSLFMAQALEIQGTLYLDYIKVDEDIACFMEAAKIYHNLNRKDFELDCLLNALNGAIIMGYRDQADSLMNVCNQFFDYDETRTKYLTRFNLAYTVEFGSEEEIVDLVENHIDISQLDSTGVLNLAAAYDRLGNYKQANTILEDLRDSGTGYDTLKYEAIAEGVLKRSGRFEEALSVLEDFNYRTNIISLKQNEQTIKSIEERHRLELEVKEQERAKRGIIYWGVVGVIILVLIIMVLIQTMKRIKNERALTIQIIKNKELEYDKLKEEQSRLMAEQANLALQNRNLKLEKEKTALETENLCHRVEQSERECDNLKKLLSQKEELPEGVQKTIRRHIEMLNTLLASHITKNNTRFMKTYNEWVTELTANTTEFMNSLRMAFQASHPRFISYFEEHGLTVDEINYVCLYAIGLKGTEVGMYIKRPGHVNMSSAIRLSLIHI